MNAGCCKLVKGLLSSWNLTKLIECARVERSHCDRQEDKLISLVLQYEILWDIVHHYYHGTACNKNEWEKIAHHMDIPGKKYHFNWSEIYFRSLFAVYIRYSVSYSPPSSLVHTKHCSLLILSGPSFSSYPIWAIGACMTPCRSHTWHETGHSVHAREGLLPRFWLRLRDYYASYLPSALSSTWHRLFHCWITTH